MFHSLILGHQLRMDLQFVCAGTIRQSVKRHQHFVGCSAWFQFRSSLDGVDSREHLVSLDVSDFKVRSLEFQQSIAELFHAICDGVGELAHSPLARINKGLDVILAAVLGEVTVELVTLIEVSARKRPHREDTLSSFDVPDSAATLV